MINTLKTLIAVTALSGTIGANVQAKDVTAQKGDTLWNLAQIHNVSVANIKEWNQLSTDLIRPGEKLSISPIKKYTVQKGDTLWDVAMENEVTVSQLMEWNDLDQELIHPGLELKIFENKDTKTGQAGNVLKKSHTKMVKRQSISYPETSAPTTAVKQTKPSKRVLPAAVKGSSAKEITVKATAYTATCSGCSGVTAIGINLKKNPNAKVISVDPAVIPLGSKVFIEGYGVAIAADTGGAIKGHRIDVYLPSKKAALQFGRKELTVKILN